MKFYEDEDVSLYNGDCIQVMDKMIEEGIKVDKIITSPPYNIIRPNSTDRGYDLYKDGMTNDEYIHWTLDIFNRYDKILNGGGALPITCLTVLKTQK